MTATFRVFSRTVWRRNPAWPGGFEPWGNRRTRTVARGLTIEQARERCKDGPANRARDAGREYRHLAFYEFERE